jgi:hypothetical protein
MHSGTLLDTLEPLSNEAVSRWITAVLAEAAALREHDENVFPATRDPADLRTAHQLHEAWTHWADDAERLWRRMRQLRDAGQPVPEGDDLIRAIGRARAMLKITPEEMLVRQEQMESGRIMTIEEVRRELRLTNRS